MPANTTLATTTCRCGATLTSSVPKEGYMAIVACACGVQHLCGIDHYADEPVRFVERAVITEQQAALLTGVDDGRIVCVQHAGSYVRSAVEAKPKQKSWNSPWGRYARTVQEDVDSFTLSGLTYGCEDCRFR